MPRTSPSTNTVTKSQLSKMTMAALSEASIADKNANSRISPAEVDQDTIRTATTRRHLKTLVKGAMAANGQAYSVRRGDVYAYAKTLANEIRDVMDHQGNRDHKLQKPERKLLSAEARALISFYENLAKPVKASPTPASPKVPVPHKL